MDTIGAVDVYLAAHHGNTGASDPATIAASDHAPPVNNAVRKGGRTPTLKMLRDSVGVDAWQLHRSSEAGEDNAPSDHIANLDETTAHWFKVTAEADGSFILVNGRTGATKRYEAR